MSSVKFDFTGKTALVTGAGRGIGRTIAKALCAAGAVTYALSKTQQNLDSLKAECSDMRLVCVDLTDWDATQKAVAAIGPVDLLVNNAAKFKAQTVLDADPDSFDDVYRLNVRAVICVTQVVAKGLISRQSPGAIVNVSSLASLRAFYTDYLLYGSSKGALDQLTRLMAVELGPHKIRVNSVNPTVVLTDLSREAWKNTERSELFLARHPLGKFADTDDVADTVLYLLSDRAAMISGSILPVDGGVAAL